MTTNLEETILDYPKILKILWDNSKVAVWYSKTQTSPPEYDEQLAIEEINKGYIDYFCGRVIKTNIKDFNGINYEIFKSYDIDNGFDKAKSVLSGNF